MTDPNIPNTAEIKEAVKLLPCPFCGGKATIVDDSGICLGISITCVKCNLELIGTKENPLDHAIKAWNTRIPKAGLPTEKIIDAINDWLSCGESRLTPDEVMEIAETIHTRLEGNP